MIVADTNLIAYLLIEGPHTTTCREILGKDPAWVAPTFWRVEFANVLCNCVKFGRWPLKDAQELWRRARALPFLEEIEVDPGDSISVAIQSKLSLYDALYVELARKLDCHFVTFDQACRKAAPRETLLGSEFLQIS